MNILKIFKKTKKKQEKEVIPKKKKDVTVRDRNSMRQKRVKIKDLVKKLTS